jgi:hypothetical protein
MSLPKLEHPVFSLVLPSTKKTLRFRPFLVKEEKILLMAASSQSLNDIMFAIKQIIRNCLIDDYDVDSMPLFDLEYFFLQLRSKSVNNIVEVTYKDNEDNKNHSFQINLDDVQVYFDEAHSDKIKLTDEMGIRMKYPSTTFGENVLKATTEAEAKFELILDCLDTLWVEEELYNFTDETRDGKIEFLDHLTIDQFAKVKNFLETIPHLKYTIKYKNSLGNDREIVLETLGDFFTLG